MTLAQIQIALAKANAAYLAALEGGEMMMWGDRQIRLRSPDTYMVEINRLERMEAAKSSARKGHDVSLADFR